MYNGWTPKLPERERLANEVSACIELTEMYPDNLYWQNRLAAALVAEHEYIQAPPNVYEVLADVLVEPETVGELQTIAYMEEVQPTWDVPWTVGDDVIFGSKEWFDNIPEIDPSTT